MGEHAREGLRIVVHGGAGAPQTLHGGCATAVARALEAYRDGGTALEAVVAAVVTLEDDGRFNAGSGSILRLDGETVEMDAAVMDSTGVLGAVAAVASVRNPVLAARRVAETPHVMLAGEGATAFAERHGLAADVKPTPKAQQRHREWMRRLGSGGRDVPEEWRDFDLQHHWNFESAYGEAAACDTVGAVAVDAEGRFAVAGSTGGSSPMLRGRVGDTPLIGCGFYAGEHGAVAATGIGEEIIRRMLAWSVYQRIAEGATPQGACEEGIALFADDVEVGIIAVGGSGQGVASNGSMAWACTPAGD